MRKYSTVRASAKLLGGMTHDSPRRSTKRGGREVLGIDDRVVDVGEDLELVGDARVVAVGGQPVGDHAVAPLGFDERLDHAVLGGHPADPAVGHHGHLGGPSGAGAGATSAWAWAWAARVRACCLRLRRFSRSAAASRASRSSRKAARGLGGRGGGGGAMGTPHCGGPGGVKLDPARGLRYQHPPCPVRLEAQDTALSRRQQGFDSPTGRQAISRV